MKARNYNIQINSLFKVLGEIKKQSLSQQQRDEDKNKPKLIKTSARDSKLTTVLAPIIQGLIYYF